VHWVAPYLLVAALAAAALLVDTWPRYRRPVLEWVLLLVIALPVTVFGDWLTDGALSSLVSLVIDTRRRGPRPSWVRILYSLACYVLFAICTVTVLYWLQMPPAV
jgi:hypothetical protein